MSTFSGYLFDFLHLFFPDLCAACGTNLVDQERVICTKCIYLMPRTNFHADPENILAKQFWGRIPLKQATAFVHFQKGSKVQNVLHRLKYKNRPEAGFRMGELYGYDLLNSDKWIRPDLIIPVPLHKSRLKKRGYNQSEEIAKGMANVLDIEVNNYILARILNTETQTRKTRFSRYENLIAAFKLTDRETLANKHVLLVDDVVTTGATLEACCLELLNTEGLEISVCAIAYAE